MEDLHNNKILSIQKTENDLLNHPSGCFAPVVTEVSTLDGDLIPIMPDGVLTDTGPYYFTIPMNGRYIDPKETRMFMQFQVVSETGAVIGESDNVSIVNCLATSFIKEIQVYIQNKLESSLTNSDCNYKSYVENCISFSTATASRMKSSVFVMDEEEKFDVMTKTLKGGDLADKVNVKAYDGDGKDTRNLGFLKRRELIKLGHSIQSYSTFPCDFFQTLKYIPPGLNITLRIDRASDAFLIMTDSATKGLHQYKIKLEKFRLYIRYVDLEQSIVANHEKELQQNKWVLLPFNKTVIKTPLVYPGTLTLDQRNLFFGTLPKLIIVGLITHNNYIGTYDANPYYFPHLTANEVYIKINGGKQLPNDSYTPNYTTKAYIREYQTFLDNIGMKFNDVSNSLSYGIYGNGMTLYAFDLSGDNCAGWHRHEKKQGHVDLHMKFTTALTAPVVCMAFGTYDAVLGISKQMEIKVDY